MAGMTTTNRPTVTDVENQPQHPAAAIPRAVALRMLAELYNSLPGVACKGLCHDACTIIAASQLERDVLALHDITLSDKPPRAVIEQAAANPDGKIGETCPALNAFGRCSVHADRPFICRAFGIVSHPDVHGPDRFEQAMMCDHGCEPEETISVEQFMQVMSDIEVLSRMVTGVARQPVAGDSRRLMGMFRRDVVTERSGYDVDPRHPHQHASEGLPTRPKLPSATRLVRHVPGADAEHVRTALNAITAGDPVRRPVRRKRRKGKGKR